MRSIVLALLCSLVYASYAAKPLFDPNKCSNGCQTDDQCPKNAKCSLLNSANSNCGFCTCDEGFKAQGNKCNPVKGYSTTTTTATTERTTTEATTEASTTTESTTTEKTTITTTLPTTTGTTTQGPPPSPEPVNCADYDCTASPAGQNTDGTQAGGTNSNCKKQTVIESRKCNLNGGGQCYGAYCLTVSPGNDYCICPYYRVDRTCAVDKPGQCAKATGSVPTGSTQLQGKRLRNKSDKDNGSIYARHFAATLNDCIKLCQWSAGACRSVNFGQISGANICELLSIAATEKNLLAPWLEKADGWQYAQVGPA